MPFFGEVLGGGKSHRIRAVEVGDGLFWLETRPWAALAVPVGGKRSGHREQQGKNQKKQGEWEKRGDGEVLA